MSNKGALIFQFLSTTAVKKKKKKAIYKTLDVPCNTLKVIINK